MDKEKGASVSQEQNDWHETTFHILQKAIFADKIFFDVRVAELVDALDSGSSGH